MKRRKQIISILLSAALIVGLCTSGFAVQEVAAQEVQEDETMSNVTLGSNMEENAEKEENPEGATEIEDTQDSVEETVIPEEKDENLEKKEVKEDKQKKNTLEVLETQTAEEGSEENADEYYEEDESTEVYLETILNGRYTNEGNFANGEEIKMEIEPRSFDENAKFTYEWYKATDQYAHAENSVKLDEKGTEYVIKKSGIKSEYYICKVNDGKNTEEAIFAIKGNALQASQYVDNKLYENRNEYGSVIFGTKVKLEVRMEQVDPEYQIYYKWTEEWNDEVKGTNSICEIEINDLYSTEYVCEVELKKGSEVIQSEEYLFDLDVESSLNIRSATCVDNVKFFYDRWASREVYEGKEVVLEVSANSSYQNSEITYAWYSADVNTDERTPLQCSGNSYIFKKDSTGTQRFYCAVTDGNSSKEIWFEIERKSKIEGIRKINGKQANSAYCTGPAEEYELEVELSSNSENGKYEYIWEKCYIDTDDYEKINATGASCKVTGNDMADKNYRCTVKDGNDTKSFLFTLYADSLTVVPTINQNEGINYHRQYVYKKVIRGEQVELGITANSVYSDTITYQWYTSSDELVCQDNVYKFQCSGDEHYSCVVSDGFQTEEFGFVLDVSDMKGTALINGKKAESSLGYDAYIKMTPGEEYQLDVEMATPPKSGAYQYKWLIWNEAVGATRKLSTSKSCKIQDKDHPYNYFGDECICEVTDGKDMNIFYFGLEPNTLKAEKKINGKTMSVAHLMPGEEAVLTVNAESSYQPDHITYNWTAEYGLEGTADGNQYTVIKPDEGIQEYTCEVSDGYDTKWYTFTLCADTLSDPIGTIDGKQVDEVQCSEGTKHIIKVEAESKLKDADISYEWSKLNQAGEYDEIINKNKNTLTFTRTGEAETYCCKVSDDSSVKYVYFNFTNNNENCEHELEVSTKKATLDQDGSITSKCKKCGDITSVTTIPYPKTIGLSSTSFVYNGKVQRPTISVVGSDGKTIDASNYTVSYSGESKDIGKYTVTVTFKGNYSGSVNKAYAINSSTQSSADTGNALHKVSKISLKGISKKIAAGKKIQLTADVLPGNANNKSVTWTSSNPKVATVSALGVVTMKKKSGGKSVIITATATDGSGVKATYKIKSMKGVVKKVAVSGKKSVKAGKSLKLKAKIKATKKANKKLKWTSSNSKYAKVSSSGKVKTYKAGKGKKVKITAMATDGSGKKKSVTIKIK